MKIKRNYLYVLAAVVVAAIAVFYLVPYITGRAVEPDSEEPEDKITRFAKCLSENNIVMYGREGCGYCARQKELFGDAFQYVTYVECPEQIALCVQKGIEGVPAWEINGEIQTGLKSLETLSSLSGCPLE